MSDMPAAAVHAMIRMDAVRLGAAGVLDDLPDQADALAGLRPGQARFGVAAAVGGFHGFSPFTLGMRMGLGRVPMISVSARLISRSTGSGVVSDRSACQESTAA